MKRCGAGDWNPRMGLVPHSALAVWGEDPLGHLRKVMMWLQVHVITEGWRGRSWTWEFLWKRGHNYLLRASGTHGSTQCGSMAVFGLPLFPRRGMCCRRQSMLQHPQLLNKHGANGDWMAWMHGWSIKKPMNHKPIVWPNFISLLFIQGFLWVHHNSQYKRGI